MLCAQNLNWTACLYLFIILVLPIDGTRQRWRFFRLRWMENMKRFQPKRRYLAHKNFDCAMRDIGLRDFKQFKKYIVFERFISPMLMLINWPVTNFRSFKWFSLYSQFDIYSAEFLIVVSRSNCGLVSNRDILHKRALCDLNISNRRLKKKTTVGETQTRNSIAQVWWTVRESKRSYIGRVHDNLNIL